MKLNTSLRLASLVAAIVALIPAAQAQTTGTWALDNAGNWSVVENWSGLTGGLVPSAVDANVTFGTVITAARTVTVDQDVTLGYLTFNEDAVTANSYTLSFNNAARTMTFQSSSGTSNIDARGVGGYAVGTQGTGSIVLNNNLAISAGASGAATANSATVALNSQITGTGGLILSSLNSTDGSGTATNGARGTVLRSTVANTFSGGVTVNSGFVRLAGNVGNLGSGTLTLNGSDSTYGGIGTSISISTGGGTVSNNIVLNGGGSTAGQPRLGIYLDDGTAQNYTFTGNITGDITGQTVRFQTSSSTVASTLTLSGNGSGLTTGTNGLLNIRSGSLILNNTHAFGSNNTLGNGSSGGWQLGNYSSGASGTSKLLTNGYNVGGRITSQSATSGGNTSNDNIYIGGTHTSGSATFSGTVALARIVGGTRTVNLTSATGGTTIFSNIISDGAVSGSAATVVPVNIVGGGKTLLNGVNTYTGATTVSENSTLGGTGTLASAVTLTSGSTLLAGTGANGETFTLNGGLTANAGSILSLGLGAGGAHGTLALGGTVTLDVNQKFQFVDNGAVAGTTYNNIVTGIGAGTDVSSFSVLNSGWSGSFSNSTGNLSFTLTSVPEPSTYAMFAGALALGLAAFRRRRH